MRQFLGGICCLIAIILGACNLNAPPESVPIDPSVESNPVYVTPTKGATAIATLAPITPTATEVRVIPTDTPIPPTVDSVSCEQKLVRQFQTASDVCLNVPTGQICNGGGVESVRFENAPSDQLQTIGSNASSNTIDTLVTSRMLSEDGGGLMWLRVQEETQKFNAMLIGSVTLEDLSDTHDWTDLRLRTDDTVLVECSTTPLSGLIIQTPYGIDTSVRVNGVDLALNGTVMLQTQATTTDFIMLEGFAIVETLSQSRQIFGGQQLNIEYPNGNFAQPAQAIGTAQPLDYTQIATLPVMLLDRPVILPQPGYVTTEGGVNLRTEPSVQPGNVIYKVPEGQIISVLGMNTDSTWFHVLLGNGETGWMKADLLAQNLGQITAVYEATPALPVRYTNNPELAFVSVRKGSNMRTGPDTAFDLIGSLTQGTPMELLARSPYGPWIKVKYDDIVGWVALFTVETRSSIPFLPIDLDAPAPPNLVVDVPVPQQNISSVSAVSVPEFVEPATAPAGLHPSYATATQQSANAYATSYYATVIAANPTAVPRTAGTTGQTASSAPANPSAYNYWYGHAYPDPNG